MFLETGTEQGLNIKYYANPEYSSLQMGEIRLCLEKNLNVELYYVKEDLSKGKMKKVRMELLKEKTM
jgi:hypothetical protein